MCKKLKRRWTVERICLGCRTITDIRIRIEELQGSKVPESIFGIHFVRKVWAGCPNRNFPEARICRDRAFPRAAAEFIWFSK